MPRVRFQISQPSTGAANHVAASEAGYICVCYSLVSSLDPETIIRCDSRDCRISLYHLTCVRLKDHLPSHIQWFCPKCRQGKDVAKWQHGMQAAIAGGLRDGLVARTWETYVLEPTQPGSGERRRREGFMRRKREARAGRRRPDPEKSRVVTEEENKPDVGQGGIDAAGALVAMTQQRCASPVELKRLRGKTKVQGKKRTAKKLALSNSVVVSDDEASSGDEEDWEGFGDDEGASKKLDDVAADELRDDEYSEGVETDDDGREEAGDEDYEDGV